MTPLRLALLFTLTATSAFAQGITIVQRETRGAQTTTSNLQMDRSHIRADVRTGPDQTSAIFDGSAQVLRLLNAERRTYSEMTKAQAAELGQQASGAMAAMQAQLASLPPAQRAMVEQMMRGRGAGAAGMPGAPGAETARIQFRRTGTDRVGQWSCTRYEGYRGAEKVSEICAAEPSSLGLTADDFEVAKQLTEFVRQLAPQAADQIAVNGNESADGFAGVPIRRRTLTNGQVDSEVEVTAIRREALPASTFAVPAGFQREEFGGGGRR